MENILILAINPGSTSTKLAIFEGEEEIGSTHLVDFLDTYADLLASDAIIIGDGGNWAPGVPGITTSLRGLVDTTITVRTLRYAVHSGTFGGTYPDAITALGAGVILTGAALLAWRAGPLPAGKRGHPAPIEAPWCPDRRPRYRLLSSARLSLAQS